MVKVSDYIVDLVKQRTHIEHVFMLSGGMAMHLIESFGNAKGIKVIPMHHEQAAGIAANAYGRMRNITSVCLFTAGPGATNAVTACAGAFLESNPIIFFSGQVSRKNERGVLPIRQKGIQEVDIISIVKSITKYAVHIDDPESIRFHLEKALYYATAGRPGPVWIDMPVDVQAAIVDAIGLRGFFPSYSEKNMNGAPVSPTLAKNVIDKIENAKRPMLVLGQGVRLSGAEDLALTLVDRLGIPTQTSWNGLDLISANHPLYFGRANLFGMRYANILIQNADLLVCIGARLSMQHTGYNVEGFARGAEIIMVDLDSGEMEKPGLNVVLKIRSDAREFIEKVLEAAKSGFGNGDFTEWIGFCNRIKSKYPLFQKISEQSDDRFVDPFYFVSRMASLLPQDALIPYGSSGMAHTVFGGNYLPRKGQRIFCFKGLAAMGYGIPCSIGAAFAFPGRMTFTFISEGGLQINIQDLQTIRHFNLPVKIVVFNNGGYHSIHMTQKAFFSGHFVASGPESDVTFPALEGTANLYDLKYFKICCNKEVDCIFARVTSDDKPALVEVMIDPFKGLEPRITSIQKEDGTMESRPLEDMTPLIPRDELRRDMYIPLLDDP